jgi:hypothetical protein
VNGQTATLARVTGFAAALIIAAILGILVGSALDSLVELVTTEQSNVSGTIVTERAATPQSNLGGLVPENPGGTVVGDGTAPDYADPYRDYIEGPM